LVPTDTPGFSAKDIVPKLSMRDSVQSELHIEDRRLPPDAMLPEPKGLLGPFASLNEARYGIIWGAVGAARDCYECALEYPNSREQFGKPSASFQLTQEKLIDMMLDNNKNTMIALHIGRLKDEGRVRPERISFGKLNNGREAIEIAREAHTILGGNGIMLEYPVIRHANNLESVRTYEGTDEMHTLIRGQALTSIPAFR
jgi:glutaryl-CoA dehydrogenase